MRCVAFDLGASGGKLFAGTFDGEKLAVSPLHAFPNGMTRVHDALYWDFLRIYDELLAGLRKANAEAPVDSIGIDSFNNDFSLIDARGELLCPVRAYRDPRTDVHADAIYRRVPREQLYALSGNQIAPFNTFMHLAAMVENGQGYLFEHADCLLMLPDLLQYALCGERVIEYTLAAETQMLDLRTMRWLDEVLASIGFPKRLLPPLAMPGTVLGRVTARVGREIGGRAACVSVSEHDTASAFLAAPLSPDTAVISCGTWALVGIEADAPIITDFGFQRNIANEGGMPGHHRILKNVMGSWLIQELIRDFARAGETYTYADAAALAAKAKPFDCLIDADDPRFFAPGDMRRKLAQASTERCGKAPDTPGGYFRTAYEALSLKYRAALRDLETLTGRRICEVAMIGGGSRDDFGCRMACDALGVPVRAGLPDATALGNLTAQLIAHGELSSVEQGRAVIANSFPMREYEPSGDGRWRERAEQLERA